ncbi:MAG: GHMP kinase, partial [Ktedonobacterales bacterium]
MVIRAKAPLRISFAGGGTDVPPFPQLEGGCVLSTTISRYAY